MTCALRSAASLMFAALLISAAAALADEPPGVALLRPDSLVGWEYGNLPPAGWTIAAGRLTAKPGATPLLSGYSFGDFDLSLKFSAGEKAALNLLLPEVPKGKGLALTLCQGDGCGRLTDGDKPLHEGAKLAPLADKAAMHTATLHRADGKLALAVDGKQLYEVALPAERRFGLGLAARGDVALSELLAIEPAGQPMFDGKDLNGWYTPGNKTAWHVEKGDLVLKPGGGNYLRTKKLYGNFTLSLEFKTAKGVNSGIGIRTPRDGWPSAEGMEIQIWDRPLTEKLNKHAMAAIYGNATPLARNDRSQQWNRMVIKADGYMISVWMNGQLVQQANTYFHPELRHRLLSGWIGIQDHNGIVEIHKMCILEAAKGRGLEAWYAARPKLGGTIVIDRLMNPDTLALPDGVTTGVVSRTIAADQPGQQVLAELSGPGALVWIAHQGNDGRLAFYFDGEPKPRIECSPGGLRGALPEIAEDNNPVTTCLLFAKSLKVVLCDAKPAAYRLEYVRFPAGVRVESFTPDDNRLPRGWADASLYRFEQGRFGTHHEHDKLKRVEPAKKRIEPGKREELLHLDGAGIVELLKLKADKKLLAADDLWIEVTVDGQSQPALAAPAQLLFAGLSTQGNWGNYLFVDRGGATTRLAMPFGNGITIAARNAGQKPIDNVGVYVAYQPIAEKNRKEAAARLRLRGVYLPAQDKGSDLFNFAGQGRWIGFVYQPGKDDKAGIAELDVDGKPVDGWAAANFDNLVGQSGTFRAGLSGRNDQLCWRYFQADPIDFQKSLRLKATTDKLGARLALFYAKP